MFHVEYSRCEESIAQWVDQRELGSENNAWILRAEPMRDSGKHHRDPLDLAASGPELRDPVPSPRAKRFRVRSELRGARAAGDQPDTVVQQKTANVVVHTNKRVGSIVLAPRFQGNLDFSAANHNSRVGPFLRGFPKAFR